MPKTIAVCLSIFFTILGCSTPEQKATRLLESGEFDKLFAKFSDNPSCSLVVIRALDTLVVRGEFAHAIAFSGNNAAFIRRIAEPMFQAHAYSDLVTFCPNCEQSIRIQGAVHSILVERYKSVFNGNFQRAVETERRIKSMADSYGRMSVSDLMSLAIRRMDKAMSSDCCSKNAEEMRQISEALGNTTLDRSWVTVQDLTKATELLSNASYNMAELDARIDPIVVRKFGFDDVLLLTKGDLANCRRNLDEATVLLSRIDSVYWEKDIPTLKKELANVEVLTRYTKALEDEIRDRLN